VSDFEPSSGSFFRRLLRDPIKLRRRSWGLAIVSALCGGVAGSGWLESGPLSAFLMALAWILAPVAASGIGVGDAFFVRHGIGQRRVVLTMLGATQVALASCVVLAVISDAEQEYVVLSGILYFCLTLAVILWLAGLISLGIGRGESYLSRRIQDVDDTGW